jgi:G2/mitotic-specific cyclin 1/2
MGKLAPGNSILPFADIKQDATLAHYAGYTEDEIEPVFNLMIDYLARPVTHEAFFKKYASKKFLKGKSSPIHSSTFN